MNPVIISLPLNSYDVAPLNASITVVNTTLSAIEFYAVFRDAIHTYLEGWMEFEPTVQRLLAETEKFEYETPEYNEALEVFNVEFVKQREFGEANQVFEHEGQKLLLTRFIENEQNPAEFSVMNLVDWLQMKNKETTLGFSIN